MEAYIEKNGIPVIYAQTPWHFKNKEKQEISAELTLQRNEKAETNGVLFDYRVYKDEKNHISGKRAVVKCGESAVFIVDVINSDEDICVYTDFSVCNTDYNVSCNVADKNKLVLRNNECGIKHFRLSSELDASSVMEKTGLMMPFKIKENGDIVYSMYEGLYSFGKEHLSCFGLCIDSLENIAWWHYITSENGYIAEPPSKKDAWEICFNSECITIYRDSVCVGSFNLR